MMIVVMLFAHSSSVAASICRHQDAHEHALARESADASIAAVTLAEDAAVAAKGKKASQSSNSNIQSPTDLLPASLPLLPSRAIDRPKLRPADQAALASASIRPLLEPPAA